MLLLRKYWAYILIIAVCLLAYSNIFGNEFVWDDELFILKWPFTQSLAGIPASIFGAYPHEGKYRPLKMIIMTVNYVLWGENINFYHIQAVVIHILVTILIYKIVSLLTKQRRIPILTAILFATHPIHTEAITFITASSEMWGIVFILFSFFLYLKNYSSKTKYGTKLSIIFSILAYFTYEITLVFPILLFSYELCFRSIARKNFAEKLTKLSPYIIGVCTYLVFRHLLLPHSFTDELYLANSRYLTFLAMFKVILKYLQLLVLPINLSVLHTVGGIPSFYSRDFNSDAIYTQSFWQLQNIIALGILSISAIIVFKYSKKHPLLSFSLILLFIPLLPVSNIIPLGVLMYEKYLYLPSFGFCLIIATFINLLIKNTKQIILSKGFIYLGAFILVGFYITQTRIRNSEWKDSFTLWSSAIQKNPNSTMAYHNLGYAYYQQGDVDQALFYYQMALSKSHIKYKELDIDIENAKKKKED